VKINPDGSFRVNGMRPGKVSVSVTGPASRGFSLLRVERDGTSQGNEFEIAAGERTVNVRLVIGYGTSTIRGQMKVVGGPLPPGVMPCASLKKLDDGRTAGRGGCVDARGQFLIENVIPGEYELRLYINSEDIPPLIRAKVESFRQRVIAGAGETQATVVFDLGQREGNQ
jgi:hypothetical protein